MEARVRRILGEPDETAELANLAAAHREEQRKLFLVAEAIEKKLTESLKPLGHFNIPELLDKRRLEYLIPNGAFESQPGFDRVYIWQISTVERNTYSEGGKIIMPDQVQAAKRNTAPRGVLVSAGLQAMDAIYSTGWEIGHIVRFKCLAPFIQPVEEIDGHTLTVMVVRDGDLISSEDQAAQLHSKQGSISNVSPDKKSYDFRFTKNGETTGEKVKAYYDPSY